MNKNQTWSVKALTTAMKPYVTSTPSEPVFIKVDGKKYAIGEITETGQECVFHAKPLD